MDWSLMAARESLRELNIVILEPELWGILVINIVFILVAVRRWKNLRRQKDGQPLITADDFTGFDDIEFEDLEEDTNEASQHSQKIDNASVAVECTYEASNDDKDLLYTVRVMQPSFESYLLLKKHRDFGLLFKHICRSHPHLKEIKSLITTTGTLSPTTGKVLKWAKFDEFLNALVALDQWPRPLCDFLSQAEDFNENLLSYAEGETTNTPTSLEKDKQDSVNPQEKRLVGELSIEQKKALKQLVSQSDTEGIQRHLWPGDTVNKYCLRLLKARKFDVASAFKMLQSDLAWRNENNWRQKVKGANPLEVIGLSFDTVEKYLPIWHQGFDKKGRPLSIQKMGCVRLPILLAETTLDKITEFQVYQTEHLVELCGETNTENWMIIIDASNFDAKNLFYRNAFKWAAKMNELDAGHNPERLGQMIIVNAPSIVNRFYNMISYLLDDVTANKIKIYSSEEEWGPVLREMVDADQLPPEYGGTGTNNLRREFGLEPPVDED